MTKFISIALTVLLLGYPGAGWSQRFPTEPIRIVVPFAPTLTLPRA
jgi:tripartite-type tricarboxylate transporter receptor subunit TctC